MGAKTQLQGKGFSLQSVRQRRTTTKIKKEKRIRVTEILLKDPVAAVDVFRPGQHGILWLKTDSFQHKLRQANMLFTHSQVGTLQVFTEP